MKKFRFFVFLFLSLLNISIFSDSIATSSTNVEIYHHKDLKINLVRGDILQLKVDAIVNPANTSLKHLGGLCGKIHVAAGPELEKECLSQHPKGINPGEAIITKAYNLKFAKHVIHTPGPDCRDKAQNEKREKLLRSSFLNSLKLADKEKLKSIAFPSISTGIFEFPTEEAARIALTTILQFKSEHLKEIYIVLFDQKDFDVYKKTMKVLMGMQELFEDLNRIIGRHPIAKIKVARA